KPGVRQAMTPTGVYVGAVARPALDKPEVLSRALDRLRFGQFRRGLKGSDSARIVRRADRKHHEKGAARQFLWVVAIALDPDAPAVALDHAACDSQAQPWSGSHKFRRAGRVQAWIEYAEELFKNQFVVLGVDPDPGVADGNQDFIPVRVG